MSGFGNGVLTVGQAATHKHNQACRDNQHRFMPFGFLASDIVHFLRRVQIVMNKNVIIPDLAKYVFRITGFAI